MKNTLIFLSRIRERDFRMKYYVNYKMERMDKMEDAERKLELTRYLRQEQNLNRMKVKNREDILYGTGKNSEMLYGDDGLELAEYDRIREQGHKGPMFGLRLAVSLMLFAGVIYLDKNQIDWKGQSAVAVISRQLETSVMGNSTVEALH